MKKIIDCLLIGHNEMKFEEYEKTIQSMGPQSGAYKDLNLNFIQYNNRKYTASEIFNLFYYNSATFDASMGPMNLGNIFSATIAYLGTFIHRRGFSFDYINSFQNEKEKLAELLKNSDIGTIAITTTLYVSVFPIMEILSFVRKYNNTAKIVIGGPFIASQVRNLAEADLQYLLKYIGADFYINSSQGEAALTNIIDAVKKHKNYKFINNIFYKNEDKYIVNSISKENNILSENMVDWSLFESNLTKLVNSRTSISCPFSCLFCGFPGHAGSYQVVDVENIEKELDSLESTGKIANINFIDDTFNIPSDRFKAILRMIIRKKYKFKWTSHFRCQFADREMVELMKESGCEGVFLGIESGNQQILEKMNKASTIEKYREGLALLNEYNIISYASFIIGFPGETIDSVKDTVSFIEENKPTFFRTQLWYCDPFTPIWNKREMYEIKGSQFEWIHKTMDSNTACELINTIFTTVQNSIWIPQYNFEFASIFNLLHRGMSIDQIKKFLNNFNDGIKEKLRNKNQQEISSEILLKFVALSNEKEVELETTNNYDVEFDF